jgi:biotin transport system substrate-specific component
MAAIAGWAADRGFDRNPFKLFGAFMAAEVVMMAMGFAWLALLIGADKAWQFGVVPFVVGDLIKVALAASLVPAVWSVLARFR